jgi:hypothetical protein
MKRRRILIFVTIVSAAAGFGAWFLLSVQFPWVNASYATRGYVRFHYVDIRIDAKLRDEDVSVMKSMLVGRSFQDAPSCGFDSDISVTLTNGQKSITFCPAHDGDELFRIGDSDRYISVSPEDRRRFDAIVKKYGMTFPCV